MFWLVLWFLPRASKTQGKGPSQAPVGAQSRSKGPMGALCPLGAAGWAGWAGG